MKYTDIVKKTLAALLSLLLLLNFAVYAEEPGFSISGESKNARQGDSISVRFSFADNPCVSIISLDLVYDADMLELTEIEGNPLMNGTFNGNVDESFIFWCNYTGDVSYNGVAFTAYFDVKDEALIGETTVTVSPAYSAGSILNNNGDDILPQISPAVISVAGLYPLGDINTDGVVDSFDMRDLILIILEELPSSEDTDVTKDGKTDIVDLVALKKILINQ